MMNKIIASVVMLSFCVDMSAQTVSYQTRPSSGSGSWTNRSAKLIDIQPGYTPDVEAAGQFTRFGSHKTIQGTKTGFFHTQKIDGRWWIIDPDGYGGFNIAMNSMNGVTTTSQVQEAYDRLWELGYNGIGNFLNNENHARDFYNGVEGNENKQFSYTRRINFYSNYSNRRKTYYPNTPAVATASATKYNYVFALDPMFPQYCAELVKSQAIERFINEPNLLGYFLDNELNFNQDLLRNFLRDMPTDDPAYKSALEFIEKKGISLATAQSGGASESAKQEFATLVAERYYHVTDSILDIYAPNHMNLGSRLHGRPRDIEGVVKAAGKYCDIVSVNFYDKYSPKEQITSASYWKKWIDTPCLATEFYTKGLDATDAGFVNGFSGAGWVVKTQQERGYFYQNTCIELLQSGFFVGWHYFKHMDDKDSNKGIMNTAKVEYTDLTKQMKLLNDNRYTYVDFYDGRITSLEKATKENPFVVNVIAGELFISGVEIPVSISLFDTTGLCLRQLEFSENGSFPLERKGVYLVHIRDAINSFTTKVLW